MTFKKLLRLYNFYKKNYDFKLSRQSYQELDNQIAHEGEFIPD